MNKQELWDKIVLLTEKLKQYRKTQTLGFKDLDEKLLLKQVYKEIYPFIDVQLSCSACVISYLNHLEAYQERELPKYLAQQSLEAPQSPVNTIQYQGIKQDKVAENDAQIEEKPKKVRKTRIKKAK